MGVPLAALAAASLGCARDGLYAEFCDACAAGYDGDYCTRADALTSWANGGDYTSSGMPYRIEDWGAFNVAISGCDEHFDEELWYRPSQPADSADTAAP